ncbi:MAG TPA: glycosyltransferase 87 family protein [Terriglobia bacterium]|nr:glycosyltransferase 87 family protein [Terriglobia bacterium]
MLDRLDATSHLPAAPEGSSEVQPGKEATRVRPPRLGTKVFPRAESAILLLLVGLCLWRGFLPAWRTLNTDFPNYYLVARIYREGIPLDRVYDWTWIARQKDHEGMAVPIVGFAPLTLMSVLPLVPLAGLPPLLAKRIWLIINLILLGLVILLLNRMSSLGLRRVMILTFLAVDPISRNFLYGQMHLLLLLILTISAWAYCRGRPATSGVALAAASALKVYPALFLFYFIRKKQWRAVFGLVAGCALLAGLSVALFGWPANRSYLLEALPRGLAGTSSDPYAVQWNSVTALLHRLFIAEPELNPHPLVHFPLAFALFHPLCMVILFVPFLWLIDLRRKDSGGELLEWGGYVALLLVISSLPRPYHFCALILSAVFVADYLTRLRRMRALAVWIILYTLACAPTYHWTSLSPSGWQSFLSFPRLYAELALWGFLLWELNRAHGSPLKLRLRTREAAAFGLIFIFLFALGAASDFRNLRGQFDNYAGRVVTPPAIYMATEPAVGPRGTWFVSMIPAGFGLTYLQGPNVQHLRLGSDAFHPAWSPATHQLWVEISGSRSRIVRIDPLDNQGRRAHPITVLEDATRPAVSADGRWLAFIREDKGRGSLWVANLTEEKRPDRLPAREIAGPGEDVWDVSFGSNDQVLYSAQPRGRLELFSADPVSLQIKPISTGSSAPLRFPAESSDGKWLAYSREVGGAWHLAVVNLATGRAIQLTRGSCNSTNPAWTEDSRSIIYATDCGRGLGLSALAQLSTPQR